MCCTYVVRRCRCAIYRATEGHKTIEQVISTVSGKLLADGHFKQPSPPMCCVLSFYPPSIPDPFVGPFVSHALLGRNAPLIIDMLNVNRLDSKSVYSALPSCSDHWAPGDGRMTPACRARRRLTDDRDATTTCGVSKTPIRWTLLPEHWRMTSAVPRVNRPSIDDIFSRPSVSMNSIVFWPAPTGHGTFFFAGIS